ncbi:MAG TPA: DnaJ domain-containing protein [Vicinamibacteria bacterium]|nr:DnaJ domain-containing protein [Vicinamibacteria bacterium]
MADYYEILGVQRNASTTEIRKAYAGIARDRHPDRFSDPVEKERAHEFFKDATAAFNTLLNPQTRAEYDAELDRPKATPEERVVFLVAEAKELLKSGELGHAIDRVRQAIYLQPQEIGHRVLLGHLLAKHPKTSHEGVQVLEDVIRTDPRNLQAHVELAVAFQNQGLALRARRAAEAAAAIDPMNLTVTTLLMSLKSGGAGGSRGRS